MAVVPVTSFPAATAVTDDDLVPVVDSPGGTPTTKKSTFSIIWNWIITKLGMVGGSGLVNVMDYWQAGDGSPSLTTYGPGGTAVTTKNISLAFERAYDAKIVTKQASGIYIPPCADYGVQAWSFKESKTYVLDSFSGDEVHVFNVVGCGEASKIIVDSTGTGIVDKFYFAAAGPSGMPCLMVFKNLFVCGDNTKTDDCLSVFHTSVDMEVTFEDCVFYNVQGNSATQGGCVYGDAMGITFRRSYFHSCTNSHASGDGGVVSVGTGTFGALFEHCNWYAWERQKNPFGGTNYDKGSLVSNVSVVLLGGGLASTAYTLTTATFVHCTWAENGRWGAVLANGSLYTDVVKFNQCNIYANSRKLFEARSKVNHTIIEGCQLQHNGSGDASIRLMDATCRRLTLRNNTADGAHIIIRADTGQEEVIIENCIGGAYILDGITHLSISPGTTWDSFTSSTTPSSAARVPQTAITKSDATDLTLTATQYQYDLLNLTGTPGGAFNIIGPNIARQRFTVLNQTNQACTLKKSGGTGVTIAANKCAQVFHNGSDYIRLTSDA